MKSGWWLAVGIGAYLAFTLSSFPAGVAYAWFAPPEVQLTGVEGTFWSGRAAGGNVDDLSLREIRWRVHPLQLLLGRVAAEIKMQLSDGFVSAEVKATRSRVELSDVRASTSLPTLRNVLPLGGTQGAASLSLTKLELDKGWPTKVVGELRLGRIEIVPLASSGARVKLLPIGDYVVRFVEGVGGIHATFNDTGGPLEVVSGTLVLDGARVYTLDCLVKPRVDAPQDLVDGLKVLEQLQLLDGLVVTAPDNEGRRRLTLTRSL